MKRINVLIENNTDPIAQAGTYMVSGYKDEATKKLVLIAVNMTDAPVTLPLSGVSMANNRFTAYTTDQNKNLVKTTTAGDKILMTPKSVTTFVGNYKP